MSRVGILLINLGTPGAPTPEAVGSYLREFLMDGFVIDVPKPLRWFLVNVMIVPRRKGQSAKAYQKVQLPEGSPLLVYTRELAEKVAARLAVDDDRYVIEYAMRYGNPSIASALRQPYGRRGEPRRFSAMASACPFSLRFMIGPNSSPLLLAALPGSASSNLLSTWFLAFTACPNAISSDWTRRESIVLLSQPVATKSAQSIRAAIGPNACSPPERLPNSSD